MIVTTKIRMAEAKPRIWFGISSCRAEGPAPVVKVAKKVEGQSSRSAIHGSSING